jgi:hypothetical protein
MKNPAFGPGPGRDDDTDDYIPAAPSTPTYRGTPVPPDPRKVPLHPVGIPSPVGAAPPPMAVAGMASASANPPSNAPARPPVTPPITLTIPAGMTLDTYAAFVAPLATPAVKSAVGPVVGVLLGSHVVIKIIQGVLESALGTQAGSQANKPGDPYAGRYGLEVASAIEKARPGN